MRIKLNSDIALSAVIATAIWLVFTMVVLHEGRLYRRADDKNPFIRSCLDRGKAIDICIVEWRYLFEPTIPQSTQSE
jgi:hypothetical protein